MGFVLASEKYLQVADYALQATHVGPGLRAYIRVQGCQRMCHACLHSETRPLGGGKPMRVSHLVDKILATPNLEGITLLGGETYLQALALADLLKPLREQGLGVFTFTGFTFEQIMLARRVDWRALTDMTDMIVTGGYQSHLRDFKRPWVESTNQSVHFLTPRYQYLQEAFEPTPNTVEMHWLEKIA